MHLVELGAGAYALTEPEPAYGRSTVGFVVEPDGVTVIDTGATPAVGEAAKARMAQEIEALGPRPIKRVVISSSRVAYSGGGNAFWSAAFYGTETTSDQLDAPPNPEAFRRLLPEHAAAYDEEFTNRPITHLVGEAAPISEACYAIPLRGESAGNLITWVEGANVVYAGALAGFRVTPLAYDGYLHEWIEALEQLIEMEATVVPGHGPIGGTVDLIDLVGYLRACLRAAAVGGEIDPGPWDTWSDRRFDAVNIERARLLAAGRDEVPQSMFALLGFA